MQSRPNVADICSQTGDSSTVIVCNRVLAVQTGPSTVLAIVANRVANCQRFFGKNRAYSEAASGD